MNLSTLRKGDRVTVCDIATGAPLGVTTIRGVLVAGRYSTGEIGHTRYWRADGTCEQDGRLSIRLYRDRDEARIEAAARVADAEARNNIARGRVDHLREHADRLEASAKIARVSVENAKMDAVAAGNALVEARARLAQIDEVPS